MDDVAAPAAKKSTTLSVDRAAFLLLRVKKAFKKKRQQRKDKQTQLANTAQTNQNRRKAPPPLLRSRTLPAIILPGIPIVSLHTDKNTFQFEERVLKSSSINPWSFLTRKPSTATTPGGSCCSNYSVFNNNNNTAAVKSLNLPNDDTTLTYRRKSSGSTPNSASGAAIKNVQQMPTHLIDAGGSFSGASGTASLMQMCDDYECHADGSVLLRIPAPHVVAARAYRLASTKKRTTTIGGGTSDILRPSSAEQQRLSFGIHDSVSTTISGNMSGTCSGGANVGSTAIGSNSGNSTILTGASYSGSSSAATGTCGGSGAGAAVGGSATNTAFTRLAKLLHQSSAQMILKPTQPIDFIYTPTKLSTCDAGGLMEDAPRRLSWERRKDSSALQRSASIDSFAEIVWSDSPRPSLDIPRPAAPFNKRPSASSLYSNCSISSQGTQLNINYADSGSAGNSRRESMLSPSSTRRNKLTRVINDNILANSCFFNENATSSLHSERSSLTDELEATTSETSVILRKPTTTTTTLPLSSLTTTSTSTTKSYLHYNKNKNNNNNNNNNNIIRIKNNNNNNNKIIQNTKINNLLISKKIYQQHHDSYENHVIRDYQQINHSHNQHAFRWSGVQLTQNVAALTKIRTAISCNSKDFKEMEFLLPHAPTGTTIATTTTTTTTTSNKTPKPTATVTAAPFVTSTPKAAPTTLTTTKLIALATSTPTTIAVAALKPTTTASITNMLLQQHPATNTGTNATTANMPTTTIIGKSLLNNNNNNQHSNNNNNTNCNNNINNNNNNNNNCNFVDENQAINTINHRNSIAFGVRRQNSLVRTKCGIVAGGAGGVGNTPHHNKMSKKQLKLAQAQLDKLTQINLHLHALFSAVEHGHLDKARTILESTDVDVNSLNSDGLSPLDVAVLSNNRSMTKMLLKHGAVDGTQLTNECSSIGSKLNNLLKDAESRIQDLSVAEGGICQPTYAARPSISSIIIGNTSASVTGCTGNEIDKQIGIWERRVKGLRRMLLGWDQARPPDAPASVTVDVTGECTIVVQILEPFEGAIGSKFKVQWSTRADFNNVVGEREIIDWTSFHGTMGAQCHVNSLTQGRRYFVRAACGNVKGWGPYKTSVPASVIPSTWRDLYNREDRYLGRQRVLDNLFTAVRLARPADVSELTLETCTANKRVPKKKTSIKQLFSAASKFQKNLRRGIYLASIVYCEDKVLVTSEDFLPTIEIDENYPCTLHSDYHWLMKIACTWDDVKSLRTDMERNLTSACQFRTKLLSAICQMQSALSLTDLGQLYYKPLRDSHGTVVLSTIQSVKSQKVVSILNSRWLPINKLQKKIVALLEDYNINEMLISSIGDQIHYHQTSMQRLNSGLYLGYLKMQCSVEQIQVVVPIRTPNVLPHCKVRDNSHITAEEWQILKRGDKSEEDARRNSLQLPLEYNVDSEIVTEVQRLFLYDLTTAAHRLFAYMNIKPVDALTHRLYDFEVIEHSKDISFLVICPSVELTCAVPGQSELLLQRDDLVSLSIQAFEMIHLRTYQPGIIQKYARLSCILELDTALANHSHREAFSTSELQTAKERLAKLQELTVSLNVVWKSVRWLMDVIAFARDKNAQPSMAMKEILEFANANNEMTTSTSKQLLQLPIRDVKFTKTGSGRGSWPGPAGNNHSGSDVCLPVEHSKSEQNLGQSAITPTSTSAASSFPTTTQQMPTTSTSSQTKQKSLLQVGGNNEYTSSDTSLRKNSADSASSQYTSRSFYSAADSAAGSNNELGTIFSIPPSRSDDTLALAATGAIKQQQHQHHQTQSASLHRKRTISNMTTHEMPTAPLITIHNSSSAPYLISDCLGSNYSLKNSCASEFETKSLRTNTQSVAAESSKTAAICKIKAASSTNLLHESSCSSGSSGASGAYLKTTPTALQTELKSGPTIDIPMVIKTVCSSTKSISRQSSEEDSASCSSLTSSEQPTAATLAVTNTTTTTTATTSTATAQNSGIIQVYTAYNTGLASGTSLKLHVTPKTTAREVINLVVKQLNMANVLKGKNGPIYTAEMLENFCLVAVIGARERCLRDDFKPLLLQNPWKKGRLYVRQKHELLAAIEHSNRKSHFI